MNREEFMRQLESLLQNISPEERKEALQYYEDYFNDAGAENEQNVIEALGNPAKVAENIKRDLYGAGYGGFTYQQPLRNTAVVKYGENSGTEPKKKGLEGWQIALIVILCILAAPMALSIGGGLLGTLAGLIASWFAMMIGFGIAAIAMILISIVLIFVSIQCFAVSPFVGMAVIGISLLVCAFGILFLMLTVAMAGIATPAIFKGIGFLFRKIKGWITRKQTQNV